MKARTRQHTCREIRSAYTLLIRNLERKRPFMRHRRRWEHAINKNFWKELIHLLSSYYLTMLHKLLCLTTVNRRI
jgi:hypothetical protein